MALGHFAWQPAIYAHGFQSNQFNSSERVSLPVIIYFIFLNKPGFNMAVCNSWLHREHFNQRLSPWTCRHTGGVRPDGVKVEIRIVFDAELEINERFDESTVGGISRLHSYSLERYKRNIFLHIWGKLTTISKK